MASTPKTTDAPVAKAAAAPAAEVVYLHSKDLGHTRPFEPAHAKALLDYQAEKGYSHWVPAEAPADNA